MAVKTEKQSSQSDFNTKKKKHDILDSIRDELNSALDV